MSYFSPNTNVEEKKKVLFMSMDFDGDGFLSFQDLFTFYSRYIFSLRHPNEQRLSAESGSDEEYSCIYSKEVLTIIVQQIVSVYDTDKDGMLSYKEFNNVSTEWDIREFIDVYFI